MNFLTDVNIPSLSKIHSGKVRESFRVDGNSRLIVATDRISCFDFVLNTPVVGKGSVLNSLAAYWFEQTEDIIDNHLIRKVDPSASLVKEAQPIPVEMIVRGYLVGSAWRGYQNGKREVSGVNIPEGMTVNQAFESPIITPTTKEKSDREISPEGLFEEGWVSRELYDKMAAISLALFEKGSRILDEKGIILVDTKYEFGLVNGELILIDEIHTPDSSRFWSKEDYLKNPSNVEQLDKEFVRSYLLENKVDGEYRLDLPNEIVAETTRRYQNIFERITGNPVDWSNERIEERLRGNLILENLVAE